MDLKACCNLTIVAEGYGKFPGIVKRELSWLFIAQSIWIASAYCVFQDGIFPRALVAQYIRHDRRTHGYVALGGPILQDAHIGQARL